MDRKIKQKEYDAKRWLKIKDDPEFKRKRQEYNKIRMEDPEYRKRRVENEQIRQSLLIEKILKQKKERYKSDKDYRQSRVAYMRWYRKQNKRKISELDRLRLKKLKLEIMTNYGGECKCCGEENIGFLTIDHIHGGGQQHRRKTGTGKAFYRWIKKHNYPDYLQILCYNCNLGRSKNNDICPHDTSIN